MTPSPEPVAHTSGKTRELVLSEERATVGTVWVPTTRVKVHRRIVTETVTVEVEVRREELVVTHQDVSEVEAGPAASVDRPGVREPLVFVLSREEAEPAVVVRPYERVTLTVGLTDGREDVGYTLAAERVDTETQTYPPQRPAVRP